jgi:hypothetical protein
MLSYHDAFVLILISFIVMLPIVFALKPKKSSAEKSAPPPALD